MCSSDLRVRAAVAAGLTVLGENRVQEGAAKIPEVEGGTWHLIGPLQSNKARRAIELFDVIESVHTADLAARLDGIVASMPGRGPLPVLLQVNVDVDPAKAGFLPEDLEAAWRDQAWPNVRTPRTLLATLPTGAFPGVDTTDLYEFLEAHSPAS